MIKLLTIFIICLAVYLIYVNFILKEHYSPWAIALPSITAILLLGSVGTVLYTMFAKKI